jgi:DNA-binding NarL/FixJ family response regulator
MSTHREVDGKEHVSSGGSGGDFLAKKSDITKLRKALPSLQNVLVIEDETFDADRLKATLRVMLGYDLDVRRAATLGTAVDAVLANRPELIFLDDVLKPSDNALDTIPFLRRAGYTGPIVVVSGQVTRKRRIELMAAGANDVIHKDDVDSVRLAEAMIRVLVPTAAKSKPKSSSGA